MDRVDAFWITGRVRYFTKVLALLLLATSGSQALTISSGPSLVQAPNAPLARVLSLTTDVPTRVSVTIDDTSRVWTYNFHDFGTNHSIPLYGFSPNRSHSILVTVVDQQRKELTVQPAATFVTPALPLDFPNLTVFQSRPFQMAPGFILFRVAINGGAKAYNTIVNASGEVVWYAEAPAGMNVRQLENGNLFLFSATNFLEVNLLGETVNTWSVATNMVIDNHEGLPTDHGTILYLSTASTVVSNYPSNDGPPITATNVVYARVAEISRANSAQVNLWSMIDMLDPRRVTYMTTLGPKIWDSEHANSIVEDPSDDSIIVSLRHQNAVVKFSRATGQPVWILGPHENWGLEWQKYLLNPVGTPFQWQYGQHAAVLTTEGTVLLYDNGNYRATPPAPAVADAANFSRAVEYRVNEQTMEVSQVWQYGNYTESLYTDRVGNAELLPQTGNILVTFGSIRYINGQPPSGWGPGACVARIREVSHAEPAQLFFDLGLSQWDNPNSGSKDCFVYSSHHIADLYGHPPLPVGDLSIGVSQGVPHLEFSADPARTYVVEASTNLSDWQEIGEAKPYDDGVFQFDDYQPAFGVQYYRVVTR